MPQSQRGKKETVRVVDLKKVNEKDKKNPKKKSLRTKIWVKKRKSNIEENKTPQKIVKIFKNPVIETRKSLLNKLEGRLKDYFSCVNEDVRKMSVLRVINLLKANKTITVSIGDCSYIFEGDEMKSEGKLNDPRVKDILSKMVKSLRKL